MPSVIAWILVVGVGACVGSFLNVCIHRIPLRRSVVRPGSACPACGRPIAWYDNIPVLSFLLLRGRCRHCRAPIPPRYPLVEAATATLFALLFLRRGPTPEFVLQALLVAALVALMAIDARHQILPNVITLPGIAFGILTSPLRTDSSAPVFDSIAGCALGYGLLFGINALYRWWQAARGVPAGLRQDGIGQGDFKLLAMIGAFLGVRLVIFTLFFGAFSGALFGVTMMLVRGYGWKSKLPYGVFLGGAAILGLFAAEPWIHLYLELAGLSR